MAIFCIFHNSAIDSLPATRIGSIRVTGKTLASPSDTYWVNTCRWEDFSFSQWHVLGQYVSLGGFGFSQWHVAINTCCLKHYRLPINLITMLDFVTCKENVIIYKRGKKLWVLLPCVVWLSLEVNLQTWTKTWITIPPGLEGYFYIIVTLAHPVYLFK